MLKAPFDYNKYAVTQKFGKPASATTAAWYKQLGLVDKDGNPCHNGIDFGCPKGTPILSPIDGKIETQINSDGCKMIWVKGKDFWVMMCHLDGFKVETGDSVVAGDWIGISGNTGKYTTGAHVHFSLYAVRDGKILNYDNGVHGAIDPMPHLVEIVEEGSLIKNKMEPMVFNIRNGYRWWIFDEVTFKKYVGKPVAQAKIKELDILSFNFIPYGGIIGKK